MVKIIFKALLVFWPFFKSVIFKDRPVHEVLRDNRQFTCLFGLLLLVSIILFITADHLSNAKSTLYRQRSELTTLAAELERVTTTSVAECNVTDTYSVERLRHLQSLLEQP